MNLVAQNEMHHFNYRVGEINERNFTDQNQIAALLLIGPETENSTKPDDSCDSDFQTHEKHSVCFWSDKAAFNLDQPVEDNSSESRSSQSHLEMQHWPIKKISEMIKS